MQLPEPPVDRPRWYVQTATGARGPLTAAAIQTLRTLHVVDEAAPVWRPGYEAWVAVGSEDELRVPDAEPGDAPAPAVDVWHVMDAQGARTGPHAETTLREIVAAGLLSVGVRVWRPGLPGWMPAAGVARLQSEAAAPVEPPSVDVPAPGPGAATPYPGAPPVERPPHPVAAPSPVPPWRDEDPEADRRFARRLTLGVSVVGTLIVTSALYAFATGAGGAGTSDLPEGWPRAFAALPPDSVAPAPPPDPPLTEETLYDMAVVYSYIEAQQASLESIEGAFGAPLGPQAVEARTRFDLAFGPAASYIDSLLDSQIPDEWADTRHSVEATSRRARAVVPAYADADSFIAVVRRRTGGDLDTLVFRALLAYHPDLRAHPERELARGHRKTYHTDGAGRALGVELVMTYPASWLAQPGTQPHTLQVFESGYGHGYASANIVVTEVSPADDGSVPTQEENEEEIRATSRVDAEAIFAQALAGGYVEETGRAEIGGTPALWGVVSGTMDRAGLVFDVKWLQVIVPRNGRLVTLTFGAYTTDDASAATEFARYAPTFQQMLAGLTFYDAE